METIGFRKICENDISLFEEWAKKLHIRQSWPFEEYGCSAKEYILKKLKDDGYDFPFIILADGRPIGYIQYCDLWAYRNICEDKKGALANETEGSYCLDLFIGDENFLGKGYGAKVLGKMCHELFAKPEVKRILIDPWVENQRAIKCYEKVGFKFLREDFDGVRQVCVMEKLPSNDDFLSKIVKWGEEERSIRAMILIGSRAQEDPYDDWADYDISLFSTNPSALISDATWMAALGKVWVMLPLTICRHGKEYPTRLLIFEGGIKVDFTFYPLEVLHQLVHSETLPVEYNVGYRVILDKDQLANRMPKSALRDFPVEKPTEKAFQALIEEFWFEVYHVVKYLKRGDLWSAKFRDHGIKDRLLLKMIEWNAQAKRGWRFSPHPHGKAMPSWVDPEIWKAIPACFSGFDSDANWKAFAETFKLFRRLSTETAELLGYSYPTELDRNISQFMIRTT